VDVEPGLSRGGDRSRTRSTRQRPPGNPQPRQDDLRKQRPCRAQIGQMQADIERLGRGHERAAVPGELLPRGDGGDVDIEQLADRGAAEVRGGADPTVRSWKPKALLAPSVAVTIASERVISSIAASSVDWLPAMMSRARNGREP
jgi:hypothetical protein